MDLSIIVPVYNVAKYLPYCLDSLYSQDLPLNDYEVICINDGSTDDSLSVLERYQALKSNLIIINQKNGGLSCARNKGISVSKGKYILFVDSDDYIAKNVIAGLLFAIDNNGLDMLCFDRIEPDGYNEKEPQYADYQIAQDSIFSGQEYFSRYNPQNSPCVYIFRKQFLLDNSISFVEGKDCEDIKYTITCFYLAKRVAFCKVDVYRYVLRPNSITTNKNLCHLRKMVDDYSCAIDFINDYVLGEGTQQYISRLIERRDTYFFFLLIRIIRAKLTDNMIKKILQHFRDCGCYPNQGLTNDYPKSYVMLSKLFQIERIFLLFCVMHKLVCK